MGKEVSALNADIYGFVENLASLSEQGKDISSKLDKLVIQEAEKLLKEWVEDDAMSMLYLDGETPQIGIASDGVDCVPVESLESLFVSALDVKGEVYTAADYQRFGEFLENWAEKFKTVAFEINE